MYAQAKITCYEDGGLLKRSHSKIIQQQCNPQGSGKPKNNRQHITTFAIISDFLLTTPCVAHLATVCFSIRIHFHPVVYMMNQAIWRRRRLERDLNGKNTISRSAEHPKRTNKAINNSLLKLSIRHGRRRSDTLVHEKGIE